MIKLIKTVTAPLADRVKLMIGRAVLRAVADAGARQFVQLTALKGEDKDGIQRLQHFGFSSNPMPGAELLVACLGGNRDHMVVVADDDPRYRVRDLQPGETCIYDAFGNTIILKTGNEIEISTATLTVAAAEKVRMDTPLLEVTGEITDRADTGGVSLHNMRVAYDAHTHPPSSGTDTPMGG
ncbi:MAG: phage baseplate assembly protein V [Alphaproteobacteria bacterium]|nr:phage baseplate assembly protein V [Alphaproteobacteria bacterium]